MHWLLRSMHTLLPNKVERGDFALSARLSAIAESLPRGGIICDIGSDHGALPLYLLKHDLVSKAIVTDLNPLPLKRAKESLTEHGVAHRAKFVLTDGIKDVLSMSPDALVIAGMGGETIVGILERGLAYLKVGTFFVLQPMTKNAELRAFLYQNGFHFENEALVKENGKFFHVFFVRFVGEEKNSANFDCFLGEFIPKMRSDVAHEYLLYRKKQIEKIKMGKTAGGGSFENEDVQLNRLNEMLKVFHENL